MLYRALTNPGELQKDYSPPPGAALINAKSSSNECGTDTEEDGPDRSLPRRAHKCWQYDQPIRRYDHYCRWLTNVIGLLNHREFLVMVVGLVAIGVFGMALDTFLLLSMGSR